MTYTLFDAGPLLCFAGCTNGPLWLRNRYRGRAGIVQHIIDVELRGLQHNAHPLVADAARRAINEFHWLDRHRVEDESLLLRAQDFATRLQAHKRRPDVRSAGTSKDWGELELQERHGAAAERARRLSVAFAQSAPSSPAQPPPTDEVDDLLAWFETPYVRAEPARPAPSPLWAGCVAPVPRAG